MLKSVLPNREAFDKYFEIYPPKKGKDQYLYKQASLSDAEWREPDVISNILNALRQTTKALEYGDSSLTDSLIAMDYCLALFENAKIVNRDDLKLVKMLNSGWVKLNKYYSITNETLAYTALIVLSPYRKWTWIEKN
jgi:hypothetical protein